METIGIVTTQNVVIEHELAKVSERFAAFLVDGIVITIMTSVFVYLFLGLVEALGGKGREFFMFIIFAPVYIYVLYHFLLELFTKGQSLGKFLMKIKVVRLDGNTPTVGDYLLRSVFHLTDSIFTLGVFGFLFIRVSRQRQRLGDLVANTTVIRLGGRGYDLEQIIDMSSLANYEVQYPEVAKLQEEDLVLIKSVLKRYSTQSTEVYDSIVKDLVSQLQKVLELKRIPKNEIQFLKTLLKDYVVLTR